jgi:hypothetical protein
MPILWGWLFGRTVIINRSIHWRRSTSGQSPLVMCSQFSLPCRNMVVSFHYHSACTPTPTPMALPCRVHADTYSITMPRARGHLLQSHAACTPTPTPLPCCVHADTYSITMPRARRHLLHYQSMLGALSHIRVRQCWSSTGTVENRPSQLCLPG